MVNDLYRKDTYLNKNTSSLFNKVIIEYDMKSAGLSLCKEYKLLPKETIHDLERMSKKDRNVAIGRIQRKNARFRESLKSSFVDIRRRFFESNDIQMEDVLSIKKDAIFCLKDCNVLDFGHCVFVEKNRYTSYIYLNRLELYFSNGGMIPENDKLDIKGLNDDTLKLHENYMIQFLKTFFRKMESSGHIASSQYLTRFITKYKLGELDIGYYREFNGESLFVSENSSEMYSDSTFIPSENPQDFVSKSYNFYCVLLPLLEKLI